MFQGLRILDGEAGRLRSRSLASFQSVLGLVRTRKCFSICLQNLVNLERNVLPNTNIEHLLCVQNVWPWKSSTGWVCRILPATSICYLQPAQRVYVYMCCECFVGKLNGHLYMVPQIAPILFVCSGCLPHFLCCLILVFVSTRILSPLCVCVFLASGFLFRM